MAVPAKKWIALLACLAALALAGCTAGGEHGATADAHGTAAPHGETAAAHGETTGHGSAAEHSETAAAGHGESTGHGAEEAHSSTASPEAPHKSETAAIPPSPSPTPTPAPTETPKGLLIGNWFASIPDYIPSFGYGELDTKQSSIKESYISTVYDLKFEGVVREDLDAYAGLLRQKGYKVALDQINETYTLTASLDLEWNQVSLVVTLHDSEDVAVYALDAPV